MDEDPQYTTKYLHLLCCATDSRLQFFWKGKVSGYMRDFVDICLIWVDLRTRRTVHIDSVEKPLDEHSDVELEWIFLDDLYLYFDKTITWDSSSDFGYFFKWFKLYWCWDISVSWSLLPNLNLLLKIWFCCINGVACHQRNSKQLRWVYFIWLSHFHRETWDKAGLLSEAFFLRLRVSPPRSNLVSEDVRIYRSIKACLENAVTWSWSVDASVVGLIRDSKRRCAVSFTIALVDNHCMACYARRAAVGNLIRK